MKKTYKISRDQYLKDIEPFKSAYIPTNSIVFKNLPGIGATTYELEVKRHSIIVVSNLPVILGKAKQKEFKDKIRPVYEGVTEDHVFEYLTNDIEFKKLITTPESFFKVVNAINESEFDLYKDFFILFDECEKIIQDIDFRKAIELPMIDFFKFEGKAFISATPILPSDPRFKKQGFKAIYIKPTFDYSVPLKLLPTNNVLFSLKRFLESNPRERYFIFLNSTDNIAELIKKLDILDNSAIFCSEKSRKKLRGNQFKNVYTEIRSVFKKYNFFTCRFFSAVDIDFEHHNGNATIVMITDLYVAMHTMIDPLTEAVQIAGRFRVPKDKKANHEIVHITNFRDSLTSMDEKQVEDFLNESHKVYKVVSKYLMVASTPVAKEVLRQILERIDYAKFLYSNGERNYNMVDNMKFLERVQRYYQHPEHLIEVYSDMRHFRCEILEQENYALDDLSRQLARAKNPPLKSIAKLFAEAMQALYSTKDQYDEFGFNWEYSTIGSEFPEQFVLVNKFGLEESEKLKFNIFKIEEALRADQKQQDHFALMTLIQKHFITGKPYSSLQIGTILKQCFSELKIYGYSAGVRFLKKFCELTPTKERVSMGTDENGKRVSGYTIIRYREDSSGF